MLFPAVTSRWRLPTQCAVCRGWDRERICRACTDRFARPTARCTRCAIRLAVGTSATVCGGCVLRPPAFDGATAAVDYDHPFDAMIAGFKFRGQLDLGGVLAQTLASACEGQTRPELLLPVPLGAGRLRERGYNQAWELARRVGSRLGIAANARLLLRIRESEHQSALPLRERAANIRGAFAVEPLRAAELSGRQVALVDDVTTTGATAHEAAAVLKQAGAARVLLWTLARTPSPHD